MSIFNLNPTIPKEGSTENKNLVEDTTGVQDGGNTDVVYENNKTKDVSEDKGNMTIVLDGPLSQIYTQALNLVYANEGTSSMVSFLEAKHKALVPDEDTDPLPNSVTEDGTYVYCIDSESLNSEGLVAGTESLRLAVTSGKYKNVILAMEADHVVTNKIQLLAEMGTALGVDVCYSRTKAMSTITNSYKKR